VRGGHRYGAGRPGWRRKCEHMLSFDIRRLRRKGRLSAGQFYSWRWSRDDEHIGSVSVRTFADELVLSYTWTPYGHEPIPISCRVELTQTPCAYGGHRSWFLCPDCGRVCDVLYGPSRRGMFACRICLRLAYMSETESPIDRCWRSQRKLEAKLTGDGDRPKGMRRKTFERINEKWAVIEERKDDLFWPSLLRLARYLD
jgi:hypothetical protein